MRKGMALGLAGIVAASLVGAITWLGGRVDAARADAPAEPQVITEHRTITKYRTETMSPAVVVVASSDAQGEDEQEEATESEEESGESTDSSAPSPTGDSESGSSIDDDHSLGDGYGDSHDD